MTAGLQDRTGLTGIVTAELFDATDPDHLVLKHRHVTKNLVTAVGDQAAALAAGPGSGLYYVTGMKLGAGSTAVSKTGAGAGIVTYLTGSHQPFSVTVTAVAGVVTYKSTWTTGVATTASPITEVVLHTNTSGSAPTDVTSLAANTFARALLAGIASKLSTDVLVVTWTVTFLGA